jgi:carbamoyl-phosphate synthase large subunit
MAVERTDVVDRFLGALEIDVDALCDGVSVYIGAVMEHVEEAGVHSGDSSCVLPAPRSARRRRRYAASSAASARHSASSAC